MTPPASLAAILERTKALGFTMASELATGALLRVLAASKPGGRCRNRIGPKGMRRKCRFSSPTFSRARTFAAVRMDWSSGLAVLARRTG